MIARTASSNGDYTVVQYVCARSRKYGSSCSAAGDGARAIDDIGGRGAAAGSSASVARCAVGDGGARAIDDSDDESAPGTSRSGSDDDSESCSESDNKGATVGALSVVRSRETRGRAPSVPTGCTATWHLTVAPSAEYALLQLSSDEHNHPHAPRLLPMPPEMETHITCDACRGTSVGATNASSAATSCKGSTAATQLLYCRSSR